MSRKGYEKYPYTTDSNLKLMGFLHILVYCVGYFNETFPKQWVRREEWPPSDSWPPCWRPDNVMDHYL